MQLASVPDFRESQLIADCLVPIVYCLLILYLCAV